MRRHRRLTVTAAFLAAVLLAAGCGGSDDESSSDAKFDSVGIAVDGGDADTTVASGDGSDDVSTEGGGELDYSESAPAPAAERGLFDEEALAADSASPTGGVAETVVPEDAAEVRAGSIDDNELWDEYLLYREEFRASGVPFSDVPVEGRQILTVVDADGDPVLGASIEVIDESGATVARLRSYADGRALFFAATGVDPNSQDRPDYTALVQAGDASAEFSLESGALTQTLALEADITSPAVVDVLFLVDATGSMGDEIEQLKANMVSVTEQIAELPAAPEARFSMVVYRDRGEEYVTRTVDFTGDVEAFTGAIADVAADAGGDTPESLNAGLHEAIAGPAWNESAVKLVFLVADAAPHLAGEPGYEDEPDYADDLVEAAAQGIKIFPIASSGLDNQGEFIYRQLAQVTMGRFVFLTYGADGVSPGDSTTHHVDPEDYSVLALDDLVVQLVSDELAQL